LVGSVSLEIEFVAGCPKQPRVQRRAPRWLSLASPEARSTGSASAAAVSTVEDGSGLILHRVLARRCLAARSLGFPGAAPVAGSSRSALARVSSNFATCEESRGSGIEAGSGSSAGALLADDEPAAGAGHLRRRGRRDGRFRRRVADVLIISSHSSERSTSSAGEVEDAATSCAQQEVAPATGATGVFLSAQRSWLEQRAAAQQTPVSILLNERNFEFFENPTWLRPASASAEDDDFRTPAVRKRHALFRPMRDSMRRRVVLLRRALLWSGRQFVFRHSRCFLNR